MARGETVKRAFDALLFIAHSPRTVAELSDRYQMSERNVFRVLDSLEEAGVELDRGRGPVSLTDDARRRILSAVGRGVVCEDVGRCDCAVTP